MIYYCVCRNDGDCCCVWCGRINTYWRCTSRCGTWSQMCCFSVISAPRCLREKHISNAICAFTTPTNHTSVLTATTGYQLYHGLLWHGLCVCWSCSWTVQKRLKWIWGTDSGGPREPCFRWGRDPPWEGTIFGVVRSIEKHWESVLPALCSKKINNGDSGTTAVRCLITLSPW